MGQSHSTLESDVRQQQSRLGWLPSSPTVQCGSTPGGGLRCLLQSLLSYQGVALDSPGTPNALCKQLGPGGFPVHVKTAYPAFTIAREFCRPQLSNMEDSPGSME
jgi:hypothetical protein